MNCQSHLPAFHSSDSWKPQSLIDNFWGELIQSSFQTWETQSETLGLWQFLSQSSVRDSWRAALSLTTCLTACDLDTGKFIRYSEENNHGHLNCFYKCVTHTHTQTGQNKENRHKTSTSPWILLFVAFLNSGQFILQQRNQPKPMDFRNLRSTGTSSPSLPTVLLSVHSVTHPKRGQQQGDKDRHVPGRSSTFRSKKQVQGCGGEAAGPLCRKLSGPPIPGQTRTDSFVYFLPADKWLISSLLTNVSVL